MEAYVYDTGSSCFRYFSRPITIFCCTQLNDIIPVLQKIERLVESHGVYAVGYLSYEAAPAFDNALSVQPADTQIPLCSFGIYDRYTECELPGIDDDLVVPSWRASIDYTEYEKSIRTIKEYIAAGDTYQVNYTYRFSALYNNDPLALFSRMFKLQPSIYSAFIQTETMAICSVTPELFFSLDDNVLVSKPMKGTLQRGTTWSHDKQQAIALVSSEKMRAENIMIVDMIRNDLGRVARGGSVSVDKLFTAEKYPSLWQLTSTVSCKTGASISEIFGALFPCASITGAPKVRTMQIIRDLECTPRGVYTGAIGCITPGRKATFGVAIRTVVIDKKRTIASYGSGGGIIADSECASEYDEAILKAKILFSTKPEFSILETIRWDKGNGYFLLDKHLDRMGHTADYFDFKFDREQVVEQLTQKSKTWTDNFLRVRVMLDKNVQLSITPYVFTPSLPPARVHCTVATCPVLSSNIFLYHKTTHRRVYDEVRERYPEFDDIILINERDELTETIIGNILLEIYGVLYTPPVECGLLEGVYRRYLLESGEIVEKVLYPDDVKVATKIYRINSVREMEVVYVG